MEALPDLSRLAVRTGVRTPTGPREWRSAHRRESNARSQLEALAAESSPPSSVDPPRDEPNLFAYESALSPSCDVVEMDNEEPSVTELVTYQGLKIKDGIADERALEALLRKMAGVIEAAQGLVLASYRSEHLLETLPSILSASRVAWWTEFVRLIQQKKLKAGNFNSTSVVRCARVGFDETFFQVTFPDVQQTPAFLVIRRSTNKNGQMKKADAIKEIFTTGLCAHHGIGPRLFAAFYSNNPLVIAPSAQSIDDLPSQWCESPQSPFEMNYNPNFGKKVQVPTLVFVSEAWIGDGVHYFTKKFDKNDGAHAEAFATKFVKLVNDAASIGVFHADVKPANLLYRTDPHTDQLELCMTDFSADMCMWFAPPLRSESIKQCSTIAMVALFLSLLRCQSEDLWTALREPIQRQLQLLYPNFQSQADACTFLRATTVLWILGPEERTTRVDLGNVGPYIHDEESLSPVFKSASSAFQTIVAAYAGFENHHRVSEKYTNCFKLVPDQPLFRQLVNYCFLADFNPVNAARGEKRRFTISGTGK